MFSLVGTCSDMKRKKLLIFSAFPFTYFFCKFIIHKLWTHGEVLGSGKPNFIFSHLVFFWFLFKYHVMNNPSAIKLWFILGLNGLGIFWQGSLLLEILAQQKWKAGPCQGIWFPRCLGMASYRQPGAGFPAGRLLAVGLGAPAQKLCVTGLASAWELFPRVDTYPRSCRMGSQELQSIDFEVKFHFAVLWNGLGTKEQTFFSRLLVEFSKILLLVTKLMGILHFKFQNFWGIDQQSCAYNLLN